MISILGTTDLGENRDSHHSEDHGQDWTEELRNSEADVSIEAGGQRERSVHS